MKIVSTTGGLTVTAPEGAVCGVYPQAPKKRNYFEAIDIANAIPASCVLTAGGVTAYYYADLMPGLYHCAASMEGCSAVCQMINYTAEKAAAGMHYEMKLDKLAGNGYEAGYVMLNTQEFIDAHLASNKDTWGEAYAGLFQTPQFLRPEGRPGRHQQTTNEEMMDFIAKLDAVHGHMHVFSLGKSPKYGYDMPLVLFTREDVAGMTLEQAAEVIRGNGKPTVQYAAQCHSTEPASTEGALAMMLTLCGKYGEEVLSAVDVYIVPRINLDGAYEVTRTSPTTGDDMNRSYLRMHHAETCMLNAAYNLFLPEVVIDGHGKYHYAPITGESSCHDVELQVGAGALNHPAAMTALGMKMALTALGKARDLGLRGNFYDKLASAAGGSAGSSYYGTRNSLSFLIETPGQVHLGMAFMERRVMGQYVPASAFISYAAENAKEIMDTVHGSRETMLRNGPIYDENDCIVLEHTGGETGYWTAPRIHVPTGTVTDPITCYAYKEHVTALRKRPRATAYILPKGLPNEAEILRVASVHAIGWYQIPAGSAVSVRQYIRDADVATLSEERMQSFEQGAWVFPNTVPSTILGVIMEPDFNTVSGRKMTLLSMGLVSADENGCLPIYRYCHDLTDGKVAATQES
ncbi:MAG: hypothetical protein E7445_10735 [Ruminococcaceae bacterium]|nr:hypothetical protein [Oscillospiraceae bacterium]